MLEGEGGGEGRQGVLGRSRGVLLHGEQEALGSSGGRVLKKITDSVRFFILILWECIPVPPVSFYLPRPFPLPSAPPYCCRC